MIGLCACGQELPGVEVRIDLYPSFMTTYAPWPPPVIELVIWCPACGARIVEKVSAVPTTAVTTRLHRR